MSGSRRWLRSGFWVSSFVSSSGLNTKRGSFGFQPKTQNSEPKTNSEARGRGLVRHIPGVRADGVQFALEGSVFVTGAAIQWLRDELGIITNARQTEALSMSVPDSGGVYLVPQHGELNT